MKNLIIVLAIFLISCGQQQSNVTPHVVVKDSTITQPKNADAQYLFMGTTSIFSTPDSALNLRTMGRPYYAIQPVIAVGVTIYNSQSTTEPFNGKGGWIAVTSQQSNGAAWYAIQVDEYGNITAIK